jgi:hypothetical protein
LARLAMPSAGSGPRTQLRCSPSPNPALPLAANDRSDASRSAIVSRIIQHFFLPPSGLHPVAVRHGPVRKQGHSLSSTRNPSGTPRLSVPEPSDPELSDPGAQPVLSESRCRDANRRRETRLPARLCRLAASADSGHLEQCCPENKQRIQSALFPDGLTVRTEGFGTAPLPIFFRTFQ